MNLFKACGFICLFFCIASWAQPMPAPLTMRNASTKAYARINIGSLTLKQVQTLKTNSEIQWWVEADQDLLVLSKLGALRQLKKRYTLEILPVPVDEDNLRVVSMDHFRGLDRLDAWIVLEGGRFTVVQQRGTLPDMFFHDESEHAHPLKHTPLVPNTILAQQWREPAGKKRMGKDPLIQTLINQIDASRWVTYVHCLAGFNRYTRGTDIRNAEAWLVDKFESIPGLSVRTEQFTFGSQTAYNVIAELPGDGTTDDIFVVGAHYDSISENSNSAAPGAEDNASGTAGVLEMAHVFSANPPSARVIFACYSGEEQGLHGSAAQVSQFIANNQLGNVKAALIMDMVGFTADNDLDTLLETRQAHSSLLDAFTQAAATYTKLRIVTSFNPFGSDHMPFLNNGAPALLVIENDWNAYPGYHRTSDLPTEISLEMGHENLKMNVATLATLTGLGFQGQFSDYLSFWNKKPQPPSIRDLNGNGLIDVGELILILNQ